MNARPFAPARSAPSRTVELLSHVPMFQGLAREDLARIAAATSQVHADRGEILFQRGDPCTGFHYVAYGQVKLAVTTPAGAEKVMHIFGPGRTFGEAVMFSGNAYPVTATALADTLLLHIRRQALGAEIQHDPQLAFRILSALSLRLHLMVRDVEAMTLHSACQRVIGYLARLDDEAGQEGVVILPAPKALIASRLNLTPEYFSRILHELSAAQLVRVDARRIEILRRDALLAYGAGEQR